MIETVATRESRGGWFTAAAGDRDERVASRHHRA
jgi:hypothetical protein